MKFWAKQLIKMCFQQLILPIIYDIYASKPIKSGTVILADAHHNQIPFSMLALKNELTSYPELQVTELYWDNSSCSALDIFRNMIYFMKKYATAETVVICDNFLPIASCKKRKETHVIQLWHACGAFKKFGYDTSTDIPSYYKGNVFANYDLITVSSLACVAPFSNAMKLPEQSVRPIGVSRTDLYFNDTFNQSCKEHFFSQYPEATNKKIVLWVPTFRGNPSVADVQGLNEILQAREILKDTHYFIIKLHPHTQAHIDGNNCSIPSEELLPVADIVITDYSSILFDAMIYKHPLILFTPDFEEYMDSRGFYLDYNTLPGLHVCTLEQLLFILSNETLLESSVNKVYSDFYNKYMASCDGHSTQRIMNYIKKSNRR